MSRIALLGLLALAECGPSEPEKAPTHEAAKPVDKDPATARLLVAAGATVFDVRSPDEFGAGHLPTAQNIPIDKLAERMTEIARLVPDKTNPIVVYCAAGGRAAKAKRALEAAGYTHVVNGGGFDDLR